MLGGNGSAEDTLRCQVSSRLGRSLVSQRAGSSWAARVLWWAGGDCSGQGRQRVPDTEQDGPSCWTRAVCTPALGAAKAPAKGCPRPCVTTARPSLGFRIRAAGQSPPENQLELIHQSRDCCGAQIAGQRLAEVPAWACRGRIAPRRSPTTGSLGRKGPRLRVRPSPGEGAGAPL